MRITSIALLVASLMFGVGLIGWTQDEGTGKTPSEQPQPTKQNVDLKEKAKAFAKLQIKWHRLMADYIEARTADPVDEQKVTALAKELEQLRKQMAAERPMRRPMRGPRDGRGPGAGPGGFGPDGNFAPGSGPGPGPGPGLGFGPGGWNPDMGPGPEPGDAKQKATEKNTESQ